MGNIKAFFGHAYNHGAQTLAGTTARIIPALTLGVSAGFVLDAGADSLVVPQTGNYSISYTVTAKDNTSTNNGMQTHVCTGDNVANVIAGSYSNAYCVTQNRAQCLSGECTAFLTAGTTVEIAIANTTTASHDILIENISFIMRRLD